MADVSKKEYRIGVIGYELLTRGLRLSGIKYVYDAKTTEEIESAIRELSGKEDVGMIIINESLARKVRDRKLINLIDSSLLPVFIEVPAYNEAEKSADTLRRLIIKAIGIDISKK